MMKDLFSILGIPSGINFNVGDKYTSTKTCFCRDDLCNTQTFCDDGCNSGVQNYFATPIIVCMLVLISMIIF